MLGSGPGPLTPAYRELALSKELCLTPVRVLLFPETEVGWLNGEGQTSGLGSWTVDSIPVLEAPEL